MTNQLTKQEEQFISRIAQYLTATDLTDFDKIIGAAKKVLADDQRLAGKLFSNTDFKKACTDNLSPKMYTRFREAA